MSYLSYRKPVFGHKHISVSEYVRNFIKTLSHHRIPVYVYTYIHTFICTYVIHVDIFIEPIFINIYRVILNIEQCKYIKFYIDIIARSCLIYDESFSKGLLKRL